MLLKLFLQLLFFITCSCDNIKVNTTTTQLQLKNDLKATIFTCCFNDNLTDNKNTCQHLKDLNDINSIKLFSNDQKLMKENYNDIFKLQESKVCNEYSKYRTKLKLINLNTVKNNIYFYNNGTIIVDNLLLNSVDYCIGKYSDDKKDLINILSCPLDVNEIKKTKLFNNTVLIEEYNSDKWIIYFNIFSPFILLIVLNIPFYYFTWYKIPKILTKKILLQCLCLFNVIIFIRLIFSYYNLYLLTIIIHFFILLNFFLINICCFEVWWIIGNYSPTEQQSFRKKHENERWDNYLIYLFGCSIIIIFVCIIMTLIFDDNFMTPNYGVKNCWLMNTAAKNIYLFGPMGFTVAINIYLFTSTALKIQKLKNENSYNQEEEENYSINDIWLKLYLILFTLIAVNYLMEYIFSTNCQESCLNFNENNYKFYSKYLNITQTNDLQLKLKKLACEKLF